MKPSKPHRRTGRSVAFRETLVLALDALRAHKLRSFLTLLGVILAVTTLVAVMSVVNGLNLYVSDKIANLGANAFVVDRFGIITNFDAWIQARKRPPLTVDDFEALRTSMKLAASVAAEQNQLADVRFNSNLKEDVNLIGVTSAYGQIRDIEVSSGRLLTEADDLHHASVCFIGDDLVKQFFSGLDPIGKEIRAGQQLYQIVGVAKARGTVFGISQDNFVMIPLSTFRKSWLQPDSSITFFVEANAPEQMDAAADEARAILRARHHQPWSAPDNFGMIMPSSITGLWQQLTGNIFGIAIWLTSVFLVVGGIVIMNIMLASVTERTREIGIRKSLGARRRHIIMQFMVEAAVMAASGGALGIFLAVAICQLVRMILPLPITTSSSSVVISLMLSTCVGLFFGIYPAMRAARLDPIEALRAEV
ncbi:MAG: ABC transporter permease [Candidatus Acidiferrales bacterium]